MDTSKTISDDLKLQDAAATDSSLDIPKEPGELGSAILRENQGNRASDNAKKQNGGLAVQARRGYSIPAPEKHKK